MAHRHVYYLNSFSHENPDMDIIYFVIFRKAIKPLNMRYFASS